MSDAPDEAREALQQAVRTNRLLLCLLTLTIAVALVDRVGMRVWTIAVHDGGQGGFVEYAYLAQREQAAAVVDRLLAAARDRHPVYREHHDVFARANADFLEPVVYRRARRLTALAKSPEPSAVGQPIDDAVALLAPAVEVVVDGYGIFAESSREPLVVMASEAWAQQAVRTRLENTSAKVEEALAGIGLLTEAPEYVQQVEVRAVARHPIRKISTVADAVRYLTEGDLHDAQHTVAAGEEGKLGRVAALYDATVEDLIGWNRGRDLTLLKVGDTIIVRKPEPPVTVKTVEHRYTTVSERTGGRLKRFKVTVEIIRHDGEVVHRNEIRREPVG